MKCFLIFIACEYFYFRFRALYKGLLPKILRLGPGGAIMLIVYDKMTAFLNMQFGD